MRSIFTPALALILLMPFLSLCDCHTAVMKLHRSLPRAALSLNDLKSRDHLRQHLRQQRGAAKISGVGVNFTLGGSADIGLYYTKLKIGSPPQEFILQIDTANDITWVSCAGCHTCPKKNNLGMLLHAYSTRNSSSASIVSCLDNWCPQACDSAIECRYTINYEKSGSTTGFFVSDIFHLDTVMDEHFSTSIIFGCSGRRSGQLARSEYEIDGILGLSTEANSLISQLSAPAFSHCLSGGEDGGGVLILGEIQNPNVVYTPLIQSRISYDVNLQSIAVNGDIVDIDPSVFKNERSTTIDSGTSLVLLADLAYNPVMNALMAVVSQSVEPVKYADLQCFKVSKRVDDIFPPVTFNFEGGASMKVKPKDYLLSGDYWDGTKVWCVGFTKSPDRYASSTTLGELILRDKQIVYDIANKRLGWASQNCSKPFNASMIITAGSSSNINFFSYRITVTSYLTFFLYLFM